MASSSSARGPAAATACVFVHRPSAREKREKIGAEGRNAAAMAAGLRLHLCPRLRAFAASFCPLLAAHPGALPPLRRAGQAVPLAARARRGFGTSLADADDFATGFVSQSPATSSFHRPLSGSS
jgi:hypothetical protein